MYKKFLQLNQRGFTLNELLVVIAIIGILAGIVIANLNPARENAKNSKISSDISQIIMGLRLEKERTGNYPNSISGQDGPSGLGTVMSTVPEAPADLGVNYSYQRVGQGYRLQWSLFGSDANCEPGTSRGNASGRTNCEYTR